MSAGEIDMGRVKLAADRIRAYLAARGRTPGASDIIAIHATACILNTTDLHLVLAGLPAVPQSESKMLEQALARLAHRNATRSAGTIDWVNCPVCKEPDMRRTTDEEGHVLIDCVNHACLSNGGASQG